jgi:hypothetical protein
MMSSMYLVTFWPVGALLASFLVLKMNTEKDTGTLNRIDGKCTQQDNPPKLHVLPCVWRFPMKMLLSNNPSVYPFPDSSGCRCAAVDSTPLVPEAPVGGCSVSSHHDNMIGTHRAA